MNLIRKLVDKQKKHIDQVFKEGLNNRSFEIPKSFEDDLNQRLDLMEKKNKRGFFFWPILIALMLDFAVLAILFLPNNKIFNDSLSNEKAEYAELQLETSRLEQVTEEDELIEENINSTKAVVGQTSTGDSDMKSLAKEESENTVTQSAKSSSLSSEEETPKSKNNTTTTYTASTEDNTGHSNAFNKLEPSKAKNNNTAINSSPDKGKTSSFFEGKSEGDVQSETTKVEESNQLEQALEKDNIPKALLTQKGNPAVEKEELSTLKETESPKKDNSKVSMAENNETLVVENELNQILEDILKSSESEKNKSSQEGVELIEDASSDSISQKKEKAALTEEQSKAIFQEDVGRVSNWKSEIQLYVGLGSTLIHDNADNNYLNGINSTRKPLNSPTFGINGNISYKRITFGLGLSYLQTGEKYSSKISQINFTEMPYTFMDTTVEVITYYQPYGTVIGDTSIISIDSVTQIEIVSDTSTTVREIKNRYSWVSIPINFGYRFSFGKYELTPRVGAQFNFGITKNNGEYPSANFEATSNFDAKRFNVSYLISLEIKRKFNNWSIFARPYFKSMIDPVIKESILERKYSSWGLQIGIGFDL